MASKQTGRTRPGAKWLRDRFVVRAKTLTSDAEYRKRIGTAREMWNERYPDFPIEPMAEVRTEPPRALLHQFHEDQQEDDEYAASIGEAWAIGRHQSFDVLDDWEKFITRLSNQIFPRSDFPYPGFANDHPARCFVAASLYKDLHVDDVENENLIAPMEQFRLRPRPILTEATQREWVATGELPTPHDIVDWCIPVYPGMTADDLKNSAPHIARELEEIFADSTADARMLALRKEGLTHREIADRLGIDGKTVSNKLKGIPRGGLPES